MPPAKKDTTKADNEVADVIAKYTSSLKTSIDAYAELAQNAAARIAGGGGDEPATTWADDAAKYWAQVARDQALWFNAVTDVLQRTTKKGAG